MNLSTSAALSTSGPTRSSRSERWSVSGRSMIAAPVRVVGCGRSPDYLETPLLDVPYELLGAPLQLPPERVLAECPVVEADDVEPRDEALPGLSLDPREVDELRLPEEGPRGEHHPRHRLLGDCPGQLPVGVDRVLQAQQRLSDRSHACEEAQGPLKASLTVDEHLGRVAAEPFVLDLGAVDPHRPHEALQQPDLRPLLLVKSRLHELDVVGGPVRGAPPLPRPRVRSKARC